MGLRSVTPETCDGGTTQLFCLHPPDLVSVASPFYFTCPPVYDRGEFQYPNDSSCRECV